MSAPKQRERQHDKIEVARRRLNRAAAMLTCLAAAYDEIEFDAGDVALAVRDIVDRVIDDLDSVRVGSQPLRDFGRAPLGHDIPKGVPIARSARALRANALRP